MMHVWIMHQRSTFGEKGLGKRVKLVKYGKLLQQEPDEKTQTTQNIFHIPHSVWCARVTDYVPDTGTVEHCS